MFVSNYGQSRQKASRGTEGRHPLLLLGHSGMRTTQGRRLSYGEALPWDLVVSRMFMGVLGCRDVRKQAPVPAGHMGTAVTFGCYCAVGAILQLQQQLMFSAPRPKSVPEAAASSPWPSYTAAGLLLAGELRNL